MPMMMDDYDDLFTDPLNLPAASPPVPGLQERLDELRSNGACRKVAWSKIGCIAYISSDGKQVHLASLRHKKKEGSWTLHLHSDPMLAEHILKIYKGRQLANLSWSPAGTELVIADEYGRLSVCSILIAINRLMVQKVWIGDPETHLNALVGSIWFNVKKMIQYCSSANRQDGKWTYIMNQHETKGPYNPWATRVPFAAFLIVTRGGYLRLLYQGQDSLWQDVRYEIDDFSTSNDLLTHAALCGDKGDTLLMSVHTAGRQLRLYRVGIDWQQSMGKDQIASLPRLSFQHLETVEECSPMSDHAGLQSDMFMIAPSEAQLTQLELLAQHSDFRNKQTALPTLLATFSYSPSHFTTNVSREPSFSVLCRWELRNGKSTLHTAFASLGSKKAMSPVGLKETTALKRLDDIVLGNIAINVQQICFGTVVAIAYSDGSMDFRDRPTMQLLQTIETPDKAANLVQVGFGYRELETCLHVAMSPNACVKVFFGVEHKPKMTHTRSMNGEHELQDTPSIERAAAAFVLQNATAGSNSNNNDDLLLTMQDFMTHLTSDQQNKFKRDFLIDLYRALGVNLDHSNDPTSEKLLRQPMLQRCLSLQAALGNNSGAEFRSNTSKLAWTLMQMRLISLTIALAFAQTGNNTDGSSELSKPDVLQGMIGLSSWSLTLTDYIVDQVFELNRSLPDAPLTNPANPALLLLLTSTARKFLSYNCRGLRGLFSNASGNLQPTPAPRPASLVPISQALAQTFTSAHLSPRSVEQILSDVDKSIKRAYASTNPPTDDTKRQEMEREMLVTGIVPECLHPVVTMLVENVVGGLRNTELDEGELYFKDFSMLGLGDDRRTKTWWKSRIVDMVRKLVLKERLEEDTTENESEDGKHGAFGDPGEQTGARTGSAPATGDNKGKPELRIRTCARCDAVMEDLLPMRGPTNWIMNLQRTCFCGNFWIV